MPVLQSSLWFPRTGPGVAGAGGITSNLACAARPLYLGLMTSVIALMINLDDRARLRERFFGATRTVLARP